MTDDVSRLRYVSGARRSAVERLGIRSVRDLLLHIPHRYLDFTHVTDIAHADVGQEATVVATVDKVTLKRPRPRMQVVEVYLLDDTGVIEATFFRQPWIAEQLSQGDVVALSGGYSRVQACQKLAANPGLIASFSRALIDDLRFASSDEQFNRDLESAIKEIYAASI